LQVVSGFTPAFRPDPSLRGHRYVHVISGRVHITERVEVDGVDARYLGHHLDEGWWSVDVPEGHDPSDGAALDLFSLYGRTSEAEWAVAGRAVQLVEWSRTHRFCGRCGTPTEPSSTDNSMVCPACKLGAYPRLAPAMITLVTRGEPGPGQEALLARGVQFRMPMYSCLAGFVEPGESLEQAVVREIREEVGVEVGQPEYRGSQPWPFPHSLMIGFRAPYLSGDIVCDPTEIVDAQWYRKDALPPIPPAISIARKLIDAWLAD
jgi:NAD+ diphosphatase